MRRRGTTAAAAMVLVLAGLVSAACSSDGSGDGKSSGTHDGTLLDALGHVRATDWVRVVEYGNLAAQREAAGGRKPTGGLRDLVGFGWSESVARGPQVKEKLGLDFAAADQALQVQGNGPSAGRLDGGVDTADVAAHLKKLSARKDGTLGPLDVWRRAPDGHIDMQLASSGISPSFNVTALGDDTLVRGPDRRGAETVSADGGSGTLAADAAYAGVARCLGSPLAAELTRTGQQARTQAGYVVGAGVSGRGGSHLTQVACRDAPSAKAAYALGEAVRERLAHSTATASGRPWSELLLRPKVEVGIGTANTVRVTGVSSGASNFFLQALLNRDLEQLLTNP